MAIESYFGLWTGKAKNISEVNRTIERYGQGFKFVVIPRKRDFDIRVLKKVEKVV